METIFEIQDECKYDLIYVNKNIRKMISFFKLNYVIDFLSKVKMLLNNKGFLLIELSDEPIFYASNNFEKNKRKDYV